MKTAILICLLLVLPALLWAGEPASFPPAGEVRAEDYGVTADGKTPSAEALQRAMNALNTEDTRGGVVRLPAGHILMDKPVTVPDRVVLEGAGASWENTHTVFVIKHREGPAFSLLTHCAIKGVCMLYPDNLTEEKMERPDEYPPCVTLIGCNNTLEYISVDGAWVFCSTPPGGANAGQCYFANINAFCHHRGFYLTGAADINRFDNIHFFPSQNGRGTGSYSADNLIGFEFGRQDGCMMNSCFIIRGKAFFKQDRDNGADGKWSQSLGYSFMNCWIENVDTGFDFGGVCGFTIAGSNILVKKGGVGVRVRAECIAYNAVVNSTQIRSYPESDYTGVEYDMEHKWWAPNALNKLTVSDCIIQRAAPAIRLGKNCNRVWIQGCLLSGKPALEIDPEAAGCIISGNIFQLENGSMSLWGGREPSGRDMVIRANLTEDMRKKEAAE
ncbi:MAG: hypothetical protein J5758_06620 [Abditibacteriota bacterium]|nr:hypothetical protein [Abditibacteriota bacterium]